MKKMQEPNITVQEWVFAPSHGAHIILECMKKNQDIFLWKTVLDIWCGTGILGIFAAQLWAKRVCASDINNKALENTHQNATRNWVEIDAREWSYWEPFKEKFDIIIANLPQEKHTGFVDMRWNESILAFLPRAEKYMKDKNSILILAINWCTPYKETFQEIKKDWEILQSHGIWIAVKWWVQDHIHLFLKPQEATLRKKTSWYETPIFYLVLKRR